ncbi:hypothetical protein FPANT_14156 [Fusarium pseudoanthophilum]|uniref:Uncharacterized protein n=1 Tax=Fusarium pseudoanthophilum TaxID=48495 RepID=A0A8H5K283_9HYPO|nr:hypothetical protein FPANT_14156 [Fusarium pseudoanthophilum]
METTTTSQSTPQLSTEEDRRNEEIRNRYFERKRHTPMPGFLKSMLLASIEKHIAEYTVEFLDDNQRLHVVLPPGNYLRLDTRCVVRRDLEKAMHKTNLSKFFEEGKSLRSQNLEMLANITKRLVEDHAALEAARREGVHNSKGTEQNMRME